MPEYLAGWITSFRQSGDGLAALPECTHPDGPDAPPSEKTRNGGKHSLRSHANDRLEAGPAVLPDGRMNYVILQIRNYGMHG